MKTDHEMSNRIVEVVREIARKAAKEAAQAALAGKLNEKEYDNA